MSQNAQANPDGSLRIHGKDYHPVSLRVAAFRKAHPISAGWGINTELLNVGDSVILFRATITDPEGRLVASGFAEEVRTNRGINATSALEVCETSAIGRALAAAGFGGDGGYASADELVSALNQQGRPAGPANRKPKHHASWDQDCKPFPAALKTRALDYKTVAAYCEQRKWGRPATWTTDERSRFLDDLDGGAFKGLFVPEADRQQQAS